MEIFDVWIINFDIICINIEFTFFICFRIIGLKNVGVEGKLSVQEELF